MILFDRVRITFLFERNIMEERVVETFDFGNDTVLQLIDSSFGNHYLITFVSRTAISLKENLFSDLSHHISIDDIVSELEKQ